MPQSRLPPVRRRGGRATFAADPLDLSLCGDCLAFLIREAAGIRSAIRERS